MTLYQKRRKFQTAVEAEAYVRNECMAMARKIRDSANYGAAHWVQDAVTMARAANRRLIKAKQRGAA